jgi:hypothetical protein
MHHRQSLSLSKEYGRVDTRTQFPNFRPKNKIQTKIPLLSSVSINGKPDGEFDNEISPRKLQPMYVL